MKDYSDIGLDSQLRKAESPAGKERVWKTELDRDAESEKSPYANPTILSKGTIEANLGGILTLKDTTGGTVLLTADPDTGVVTIGGDLTVTETLSGGTVGTSTIIGGTATDLNIHNPIIGTMSATDGTAGTLTIDGGILGTPAITEGTATTLNVHGAIIGTPALTAGTVNPASYEINGTVGIPGTIVMSGDGTTHTLTFEEGILVGYAAV